MKRIFAAAALLLLLTSCTVQGTMNPEIFVSRLGDLYPPVGEGSELLFDEGNAYCFVVCESGNEMLIGMALSDNGTVTKVSVNGDCADKAGRAEFAMLAQKCVTVFAAEETQSVTETLLALGMTGEGQPASAEYCDTKWYRYAFVPTDEGYFFSVESRRAVPDSEIEFSLREAG